MSETFGDALRRARERLGWEREQVEVQAGAHPGSLEWWEQGTSSPTIDEWNRLAELLGIDPDTKRAMGLARIREIEARKPPEQRGRPPRLEPGRSPFRRDPNRH